MSDKKSKPPFRMLDLDQAFAEFDLDRREHGRAVPSSREPVILFFEDQRIPLEDISAGGCAFMFSKHLETGWVHEGSLQLPNQNGPFEISLIIVLTDPNHMVHCRFENLPKKHFNQIQEYVLQRQEELLAQVIDPSEDDSILP